MMSTLVRANIKSYDVSTHSATVQIIGSLAVWLDAVPVSAGIAPADVVAGRECGVIFFTDDNPTDASIVTIHNVVPTGWSGGTPHVIKDADNDTSVEVEKTADEDKIRMTALGTLRYLIQDTSPHHTLTGDVKMSGYLGVNNVTPGTVTLATVRKSGTGVSGYAGLIVDVGLSSGDGSQLGGPTAIQGFAYMRDNAGFLVGVCGLDFQAGYSIPGNPVMSLNMYTMRLQLANTATTSSNITVNEAGYIDTNAAFNSLPAGITTYFGLRLVDIGALGQVSSYGVLINTMSKGSTRTHPFYDQGVSSTDNKVGNVFRTNTQFGSTTLAFGGGDGVIGLAYASTNVGSSPATGVVIWVPSSTGHLNIRGASGQVCKIPTCGATNVTGSRGGNAALASLMTALAALGLVVDGTT